MARNSISLSTYALIDGIEHACEPDGRLITKDGQRSHRTLKRWDGPFKLRWREWTVEGGVRKRAQRSKNASDVATLRDLVDKVRRPLEVGGVAPEAEAREVIPIAALDQVALCSHGRACQRSQVERLVLWSFYLPRLGV